MDIESLSKLQEVVGKDVVDFEILLGWMDEHSIGSGPIENVRLLAGGTQNILVRFDRENKTYVLRRPPVHLRKASNEVLRREATILKSLGKTSVPHPKFILGCDDETVMGVVFYLMEYIEGFNPATGLPECYLKNESFRFEMGLDAVKGAAVLGSQDYISLELQDYGKPEGFLERQVNRWLSELESYSVIEGYEGPQIAGLEEVSRWLEEFRPITFEPGIMHGDYHLANLYFDLNTPKLSAILDWEMSTIGDPLVDLGWLIATWPGDDALAVGPAMGLKDVTGFPTKSEMIEHYSKFSTRDLVQIDWYVVFACFKLGIILEGTHARACGGKADKGVGDLLHSITVALFDKALKLC